MSPRSRELLWTTVRLYAVFVVCAGPGSPLLDPAAARRATGSEGTGLCDDRVADSDLETQGPRWTAAIDVRQGEVVRTLYFGVHPEATAGIDRSLAELDLPPWPPRGVFDVRFTGPRMDNGVAADLRGLRAGEVDTLVLSLQWGPGGPITFSWNPEAVAELAGPARLQDTFDGATGIDVDMTKERSLTLNNPAHTALHVVFAPRAVSRPRPTLVFSTQPQGAVDGHAFTVQPQVVAMDRAGCTVEGFEELVDVFLVRRDGGGGRLRGTTTVRARRGVATFTGLRVVGSRDGAPYALGARDLVGGVVADDTVSEEFVVDVRATRLRFERRPTRVSSASTGCATPRRSAATPWSWPPPRRPSTRPCLPPCTCSRTPRAWPTLRSSTSSARLSVC